MAALAIAPLWIAVVICFEPALFGDSLEAYFQRTKTAAEEGDARAQSSVGSCYESGDGVAKNINEAMKWYERSAMQGFGSAQISLGQCYFAKKEYILAYKWINIGARQPYVGRIASEAVSRLQVQVAGAMTQTQIAAAEKQIRAFKPTIEPAALARADALRKVAETNREYERREKAKAIATPIPETKSVAATPRTKTGDVERVRW